MILATPILIYTKCFLGQIRILLDFFYVMCLDLTVIEPTFQRIMPPSLTTILTAVPYLHQVLECGEEKVLTLTEVERIKALAAQLVKLLRAQKNSSLPVSQLLTEYSKTFGYGLRLQDYDASSLPALLTKLCHVVKVKSTPKD